MLGFSFVPWHDYVQSPLRRHEQVWVRSHRGIQTRWTSQFCVKAAQRVFNTSRRTGPNDIWRWKATGLHCQSHTQGQSHSNIRRSHVVFGLNHWTGMCIVLLVQVSTFGVSQGTLLACLNYMLPLVQIKCN